MKKSKVAEKLTELRHRHGYRLYEVAQGTGLTKTTISRYENSKRENIGLHQLKLLAQFYKIDIEYLTNDDYEESQIKNEEILHLFCKLSDTGKAKLYQNILAIAREEKII